MSILGNIFSSIFGDSAAASTSGTPVPATPAQRATAAAAKAPSEKEVEVLAPERPTVTASRAPAQTEVDVAAILDGLARQWKEKDLDWRKSIVDLMKLLNLDSSFKARKELARELHYTGDMKKSAQMNVWLHKQVMTKLAENGGKVPDDLKA